MDRNNLLLWCRKKCNNETLEDTEDFSLVLDNIIDMISSIGVTSESIGDLSQSFGTDKHKEIMLLLSPYRKAKFL